MIPDKKDNPNGLHRRYVISKSSGEPIDPRAIYFVLRIDEHGDDPQHIEACRAAAAAYADYVQNSEFSHLAGIARDLRALLK